jgi:hypothetical protein
MAHAVAELNDDGPQLLLDGLRAPETTRLEHIRRLHEAAGRPPGPEPRSCSRKRHSEHPCRLETR